MEAGGVCLVRWCHTLRSAYGQNSVWLTAQTVRVFSDTAWGRFPLNVCVWLNAQLQCTALLFRPTVWRRKGRRGHRKKRKVEEGVGSRSIMISRPRLIGMRSVCVWLHCIPAWLPSFMLPKIKMNARKYPAGMESGEKEETQGEGIPRARGAGWHHIPGARFLITTRYCCNSVCLGGPMWTVEAELCLRATKESDRIERPSCKHLNWSGVRFPNTSQHSSTIPKVPMNFQTQKAC